MSKIKNNTGITSKDFYEDFTEEVEKGKRIIIFLSHGVSYAKEYSFLAYTNKQFNRKKDKYIVAIKHLDRIECEKMKPIEVIEILQKDINQAYDEFSKRYPDAKLEKPAAVTYAMDYSEKNKRGELMAIAIKRIDETYVRSQFSPIINLTEKQYKGLIGEDDSKEGTLLRDILTEKRLGIEQYGLAGLLTDGKLKTYDLYMQSLLDIIPNYKGIGENKKRKMVYANYRASMRAYLFSIKTEEEKQAYNDEGNEVIM